MILTLGQLRLLIERKLSAPSFVHLSIKDLGETFTFTPRNPAAPYIDIEDRTIEDDFTKRSSWAPSIVKAKEALEGLFGERKPLFVYSTDKLPGDVDLADEFDNCPNSPGNDYGPDFLMSKWRDYVADAPPKIQKKAVTAKGSPHRVQVAFKKCVPDATRTKEHWATKPVTAKRIGVTFIGNPKLYSYEDWENGVV